MADVTLQPVDVVLDWPLAITPTMMDMSTSFARVGGIGFQLQPEMLVMGTAQPGVSVEIYVNGYLRGAAVADRFGNWSTRITRTASTVVAYAVDATGARSAPSAAVKIVTAI